MNKNTHFKFKPVISAIFISMLYGIWSGLYTGLGESLYLSFKYQTIKTDKIFILKVVTLHLFFGVFLSMLSLISLGLYKYSRPSKNFNLRNVHFLTATLICYSIAASYLIIDADFFYYRLNIYTWSTLILLLIFSVKISKYIFNYWSKLPKILTQTISCTLLIIMVAVLMLPQENYAKFREFIRSSSSQVEYQKISSERPNVIFYLIDALDYNHISSMGYGRKTTPFLDSLSKKSISVKNYHAPTSTGPSLTSLFTGISPETTKYNAVDDVIEEKYFLLGELFKKQDYQTSIFSWTYYIDSLFGFGQGVDNFKNFSRLDPAGYSILKRGLWIIYKNYFPFRNLLRQFELKLAKIFDPKEDFQESREEEVKKLGSRTIQNEDMDDRIISSFFDWLDVVEEDEPFFSFLHLQGVHTPYVVPDYFKEGFISNEVNKLLGQKEMTDLLLGHAVKEDSYKYITDLYDTRLLFSDFKLKEFFQKLTARGLDKNLILIVLGDHGTQINKLKDSVQVTKQSKRMHTSWENLDSRPMLMIYYPERFKEGVIIEESVLSIDILPTLAEHFDITLPAGIEGKSFHKHLISKKND